VTRRRGLRRTVLLLGGSDDPTIQAVERQLSNGRWQPVVVTPEILVDEIEPNDSIGPGPDVKFRWHRGTIDLDWSDIRGVLNLLTLPLPLFQSRYEDEDAEYAWAEWNAYLAFVLGQLPNVINRPSTHGVAAGYRSLPFQWGVAKRFDPGIGVPRRWFGTWRQVQQWTAHLHNVVVTVNPYAYEWWMPGSPDGLSGDEPVLAYIRPSGTPVVVTVLDSYVVGYGVAPSALGTPWPPAVDQLVQGLSHALRARLMQILLFFSESSKTWTFGAATPNFSLGGIAESERPRVIERLADALTAPP